MISAAIVGCVFEIQPSDTTITYSGIDKESISATDYKSRESDDSLLLKADNSAQTLEELLGEDENSVPLEV